MKIWLLHIKINLIFVSFVTYIFYIYYVLSYILKIKKNENKLSKCLKYLHNHISNLTIYYKPFIIIYVTTIINFTFLKRYRGIKCLFPTGIK